MLVKFVLGGFFALVGAAIGWYAFNTVSSAIGIGSAMAAGIYGVLVAAASPSVSTDTPDQMLSQSGTMLHAKSLPDKLTFSGRRSVQKQQLDDN